MIGDFAWLAIVSGACVTNILAQLFWLYAFRRGGLFPSLFAGFAIGGLVLISLSVLFRDHSIFWHALNFAIYACFVSTYFHWNNMGETGRRVRLMIELAATPDGLTRAELMARYGHKEIVDRRIDRMLKSQQICQTGSRFHMENLSFLAMARIVWFFKLLLNIR
jgi:hypothetical protein